MKEVPSKAVRRQTVALIPVYMNILMFGCGTGWLPNAMYFLLEGNEIHATLFECSLVASFSELGRFVFAIPAGVLMDKYGRKKALIGAAVLNLVSGLVLLIKTSIVMMCVSRCIHGLALALIDTSALIIIGEIASPEVRGQLSSKYGIFISIGCLSISITSVVFNSYQLLTYVYIFFSVITLLSMYLLIETPSFLISVVKLEQAKTNWHYIRKGFQENEINEEFEKLQNYINNEKIRKNQVNWVKFLKLKMIRKPLIIGILSNCFTILTGGITVIIYITSILPSNKFVSKRFYPLVLQVIFFFCSLTIPLWIDKFPRRTLFLFGAAKMVTLNLICAMANCFLNESESESVIQWIFVLGIILIRLCFGMTVFPMNNAIHSELYPQIIKGFCGSLGIISQALALIISIQLYSYCKVYGHLYIMHITCAINSLILFFIVYFHLPEGRGVPLSDLQLKFQENPEQSDNNQIEKNTRIS